LFNVRIRFICFIGDMFSNKQRRKVSFSVRQNGIHSKSMALCTLLSIASELAGALKSSVRRAFRGSHWKRTRRCDISSRNRFRVPLPNQSSFLSALKCFSLFITAITFPVSDLSLLPFGVRDGLGIDTESNHQVRLTNQSLFENAGFVDGLAFSNLSNKLVPRHQPLSGR
jgi:hypothetical protein